VKQSHTRVYVLDVKCTD